MDIVVGSLGMGGVRMVESRLIDRNIFVIDLCAAE